MSYENMSDEQIDFAIAMRGCEIVESKAFPDWLELQFQGKRIHTLQRGNWAYSAAIQWTKVDGKLPRWATDLNNALALRFGDCEVIITLDGDDARVVVNDPMAFVVAEAEGTRQKLARVISEAWLTWWEATREKA